MKEYEIRNWNWDGSVYVEDSQIRGYLYRELANVGGQQEQWIDHFFLVTSGATRYQKPQSNSRAKQATHVVRAPDSLRKAAQRYEDGVCSAGCDYEQLQLKWWNPEQ